MPFWRRHRPSRTSTSGQCADSATPPAHHHQRHHGPAPASSAPTKPSVRARAPPRPRHDLGGRSGGIKGPGAEQGKGGGLALRGPSPGGPLFSRGWKVNVGAEIIGKPPLPPPSPSGAPIAGWATLAAFLQSALRKSAAHHPPQPDGEGRYLTPSCPTPRRVVLQMLACPPWPRRGLVYGV